MQIDENTEYSYRVVAVDEDDDDLTYALRAGPAWLSVDGRSGLLQGRAPHVVDDERFRVEVSVSDGTHVASQSYDLFVIDTKAPIDPNAITIRGTLQDSERNTGRAGEVRAYQANGDGTYTLLDADRTDADGDFIVSFNEDVAEFDLQARLKDGDIDAGYVRTVKLPGESNPDLLVRAVPYTGLNGNTTETAISIEHFRDFILDTMDGGEGIHRWNLESLQGIEVIDDNPTPNTGQFSQEQASYLKNVSSAEDGVRMLFDGRNIPVQIDSPLTPDSEKHYQVGVTGNGLGAALLRRRHKVGYVRREAAWA